MSLGPVQFSALLQFSSYDQELSLKALRPLNSCQGYPYFVNNFAPLVCQVFLDHVLAHISELLTRCFQIGDLIWSDGISAFTNYLPCLALGSLVLYVTTGQRLYRSPFINGLQSEVLLWSCDKAHPRIADVASSSATCHLVSGDTCCAILAPYYPQDVESAYHMSIILPRHTNVNCLVSLNKTNHVLPCVMYKSQSYIATCLVGERKGSVLLWFCE